MSTPRYRFHDSQATSPNPRNTAINPRYWVVDLTTNRPIDEFTSAKAARDTVRHMNASDGDDQ